MKPVLPVGVKIITQKLEENGKRAHIVGGCVRDFLLSKVPFDYDITTDALPDEMKRIFSDMKTVETGIKHGTLTVMHGGVGYEVTTYRVDGEYEDHRRPKSVTFTDTLSGDLSRRDFTMNAIAYSERDGFVDMFSGAQDIENKIVRAVGDPKVRFEEDALRILRGIRFAAVLGFDIEEKTARAAIDKADLLSVVSAERIYSEWKKLICGDYAYGVIDKYKEIIRHFLFSDNIVLPSEELFSAASAEARQLSLFVLSLSDPKAGFIDFAERMKTDSKTRKTGISVLSNLKSALATKTDARLLLIKLGANAAELIRELKVLSGENEVISKEAFDEVVNGEYPLSLAKLKVNGEDLKSIGILGCDIGRTLERLLIMTATDEVKNEREELISAAKDFKNGI